MNDLSDFHAQLSSEEAWQFLLNMSHKTRNRKLKLAFISSTAQGGGVALMRHAIIRLFRLLHIDAHWYVTRPSPAVFDITKRKIHNVLQDVASLLVRTGLETGSNYDDSSSSTQGNSDSDPSGSDNNNHGSSRLQHEKAKLIEKDVNDVWLNDDDERILQDWWKDNAERYWERGVFRNMDVIVIDDPQRTFRLVDHVEKYRNVLKF